MTKYKKGTVTNCLIDLQREVAACTGTGRRVARFLAYRRGEPAGAGGLTFFDRLGLALIWTGGVRTAHRGHGVYTALLKARAAAAQARGIPILALYAKEDSSAPILDAQGFERHGPMVMYDRSA